MISAVLNEYSFLVFVLVCDYDVDAVACSVNDVVLFKVLFYFFVGCGKECSSSW